MADVLTVLLERLAALERRVAGLPVLEQGQRVAVISASSSFANGAAVDAAFLAAVGIAARAGDALVVHRTSDDHLLVLINKGTAAWDGVNVSGSAVSYS